MTSYKSPAPEAETRSGNPLPLDLLESAFSYDPWIRRVTSAIASAEVSRVHAVAAEALNDLKDDEVVESLALFRPLGPKPALPTASPGLPEAGILAPQKREQPWLTVLRLCEDYKARFGYIYLVNVSGKSDESILSELRSRLTLPPHEELKIVRKELYSIVTDRLRRLAVPSVEQGENPHSD